MGRVPAELEIKFFMAWIKRRERKTYSFYEKFDGISLKLMLTETNERLGDEGKIVFYPYYRDRHYDKNRGEDLVFGRFYKIKFVENEG